MLKHFVLSLASCLLLLASVQAQELEYSLPQALPYGVNASFVLGQNSEGILVHLSGRSHESIQCYDPTSLALKWKKDIAVAEKSATVEKVFLAGDSLMAFYTVYQKGSNVLKANLYSPRLNLLRNAVAVDTASALLGEGSTYRFRSSTLRSHVLVYTGDEFSRKREIRYAVFNAGLQTVRAGRVDASRLHQPDLINGYVTDHGDAWFLCGDGRARNFNNAYLYTTIGLFHNDRYIETSSEGRLLSDPLFRFDMHNNAWVVAGLFSTKPGNEAHGTYFMRGALTDTVIHASLFLPFTEDFLTNIGQQNKRAGFRDFVPTDMVVKRDGGVIFVTESQSEYSETLSSTRMSTMGSGPGLVTNHFYYNDLVVFATDSNGAALWSQVLRKKQQSDNDGGYYLSYGLLVGPRELWMVYNDRVSGENNLSAYAVSGTGENKRTALVSTDRKSLAPVPAQGKQIAANALVLPSLRKGFFQLIKITFPA
ncbi:MAG TPA: hypothetical protein VEY71_11275 [Chitinophagales bacterium]|nr:hypothetical protein [Chitinophagales bacterium]